MVMKSTIHGHFGPRPQLGRKQKNGDKVAVKKDGNPDKKPTSNYGVGGFKGRLG